MTDPAKLKFTETHEWVRVQGDRLRVGVSDFAQQKLSDIIHVDLPEPDDHHYEAGEEMCVLESLKTAADVHAPLSGIIVAINSSLLSKPELVNSDPYGDGWLVEMHADHADDVNGLADYDEYEASLPEEEEEP